MILSPKQSSLHDRLVEEGHIMYNSVNTMSTPHTQKLQTGRTSADGVTSKAMARGSSQSALADKVYNVPASINNSTTSKPSKFSEGVLN